MTQTLADFTFDLSLRGLGQQERVLEELRARSGTLLAAASLVASFLGGRALDAAGFSALNIAAGSAFLITVITTVYVLAPRGNLEFAMLGSAVAEYFTARDADIEEVRRTLTEWIDQVREDNQLVVDRLVACFRLSCVVLLLEALLWSLSLALH